MYHKQELTIIDYIVLSIGMCVSLATGIFYAYKERNKQTPYRYHRGDGKLKVLLVALSIIVTFESSVFFLGYPAEVYVHGFQFWLFNIGLEIGYSSLLWLSIPVFYRLQVTSVYEYLQMRHDSLAMRQLATCLAILYMTIYAGIVTFGAAIAMEGVTNIPTWVSVFGLTFAAVIYTALGGLKAVIATDVVQGMVMIISILVVLIYGTVTVGGIGNVLELNEPSGRLKLVDFDPNPWVRHTFWTLVVGGAVRCVGIACRQPTVQRMNSIGSIGGARKVAYISITGFVVLQMLVMAEGLVAFAYFSAKGCDPLASGQIANPNQIISYTVVDMFQQVPGVAGLFMSALCSASMSTISSLLSRVSAIVTEDFVKLKLSSASARKLIRIAKLIVVLCGVSTAVVAILVENLKGPMGEITGSILGAIDSPMLSIFFLSIFVRFTTRKGIYTAVIFGMATALWLSLGYNFSTSRKVTPWLPLGPTDSCFNAGVLRNMTTNSSNVGSASTTADIFPIQNTNTTINSLNNSTFDSDEGITGIGVIFSISYMYFGAIVLIVSVAVGLVVSLLTASDNTEVSENLILSARSLCPKKCIPRTGKSEADQLDIDVLSPLQAERVGTK